LHSCIKKVKITFPFQKPDLKNQFPTSDFRIGNFQFDINPGKETKNDVYDYWVVYENLHRPAEHCFLKEKKNTIFIAGEPPSVKKYLASFLKQFHLIITSHEIANHPKAFSFQQALPWTINKNYCELKNTGTIPKSKFMSIITSNKKLTDGHKKRLEFALQLKSLYPEHIDLYGRGINDFENKWDVLAPYKYHICIENSSIRNYFTEKITDSFLCLSFPLYYGCTNIESYFSENSFIKIDIDKIDECKMIIDSLIENNSHYEKSLPFLKKSKAESLDTYNLFPFIKSLIEEQFPDSQSDLKSGSFKKVIYQAPVDMLKFYARRFKSLSK
jgi:hypothetical protein